MTAFLSHLERTSSYSYPFYAGMLHIPITLSAKPLFHFMLIVVVHTSITYPLMYLDGPLWFHGNLYGYGYEVLIRASLNGQIKDTKFRNLCRNNDAGTLYVKQ